VRQRIVWSLLLFVFAACAATARQPGAVAAPERIAAAEGARVLRAGGNAVDAAVCVGFVLAVTHPEAEQALSAETAWRDSPSRPATRRCPAWRNSSHSYL